MSLVIKIEMKQKKIKDKKLDLKEYLGCKFIRIIYDEKKVDVYDAFKKY